MKEGNELIVISARGGMIEEMKDVAMEKFKEEKILFNTYYWKQDDKLEVAQKENIDFMIDDSYDVCKKYIFCKGIKIRKTVIIYYEKVPQTEKIRNKKLT